MSVEQIDKVDFIGTLPNGNVQLTISDHLNWNETNEHLIILQDKINSYLDFIENEQLYEVYPYSINKQIIISVVFKHNPNEIAKDFLQSCKETIESINVHFNWEVLKNSQNV